MMKRVWLGLTMLCVAGAPCGLAALDLHWPTPNDAIRREGNAEAFYQPTVEGTVASGMFGCARRSGVRFHEGIDIRCLQRDRQGECVDPVYAVSDGAVAFVNDKPGLSNYGRYIVLRHNWDGVTVHTLYAHLREVAKDVAEAKPVNRGQLMGVVGRSANTREGISPERAHLHFEICFLMNSQFDSWYRRRDPKAPPFGNYNGQNLFGIDPMPLLLAARDSPGLNFAHYMARQPVAFTVLVGAKPFSWLQLHPEQIQRVGADVAPVAFEVGVTVWGVPVAVWPRGASEVSEAARKELSRGKPVLLRINQTELDRGGCRGLVRQSGGTWQLTTSGQDWVSLLLHNP